MQDPLLDCEADIRDFLAEHTTSQCPPLLAQAMEYAVFPGGARVRPQLCMAVARPTTVATTIGRRSSDGGGVLALRLTRS